MNKNMDTTRKGIPCTGYIDLRDGQRRPRPYMISKGYCGPAIPPPIGSEKPTQWCQGKMATIVASGNIVRPLSNNDAAVRNLVAFSLFIANKYAPFF